MYLPRTLLGIYKNILLLKIFELKETYQGDKSEGISFIANRCSFCENIRYQFLLKIENSQAVPN